MLRPFQLCGSLSIKIYYSHIKGSISLELSQPHKKKCLLTSRSSDETNKQKEEVVAHRTSSHDDSVGRG